MNDKLAMTSKLAKQNTLRMQLESLRSVSTRYLPTLGSYGPNDFITLCCLDEIVIIDLNMDEKRAELDCRVHFAI
jgi:hypothetical protein